MDEPMKKRMEGSPPDADFGLMLWKLESLQEFLPCYQSLMKKHHD